MNPTVEKPMNAETPGIPPGMELNPQEQDRLDMARLAEGHDPALNDLMDRHAQKLFHYLIRSLQDEADAADLAQETFVRVFKNRAKYKIGSSFSVWLYAIASNLVRDRFRWRRRHVGISLEAEDERTGSSFRDTIPSPHSGPDECVQASERAAAVRTAVASLPRELRLPLILAEYEEKSQAEIGAILNCSVKSVETRIYRARKKLRDRLKGLI